jgi:hypothetical protein
LDNGNRFQLRQERHISLLTELEMVLWLVGYNYFAANREISCAAQNANILERRLAVGIALAKTLKAD